MTVKKGFSKGKGYYGKGSKKLNLPSQSIDRRKSSAYRTSKPKSAHIEDGKLVFSDGHTEELTECEKEILST